MADIGTILVTGGVGTVGSEVVRLLLAAGHRVRATAHFPDLEAESRVAAVDYVEVEYLRPETLETALRGVSRLMIIVPETPDSRRATANLMKAAEIDGVERVVKLSFLNAGTDKGGRVPQWHARAEKVVRASDVPWTILRPNLFMQNFATLYGPSIITQGGFRLPLGDGRVSYVDVRDVAAVAVTAMVDDGFEGRTLDVTGPEAYSHDRIAEMLSAAVGSPVHYVDENGSDARVCLERVGEGAELAAGLEELWEGVRAGDFAAVSPVVPDVLGRPAIGFADFARDYRQLFVPTE